MKTFLLRFGRFPSGQTILFNDRIVDRHRIHSAPTFGPHHRLSRDISRVCDHWRCDRFGWCDFSEKCLRRGRQREKIWVGGILLNRG